MVYYHAGHSPPGSGESMNGREDASRTNIPTGSPQGASPENGLHHSIILLTVRQTSEGGSKSDAVES